MAFAASSLSAGRHRSRPASTCSRRGRPRSRAAPRPPMDGHGNEAAEEEPPASAAEWEALVDEFERRALARRGYVGADIAPSPSEDEEGDLAESKENPEQYKFLRYSEAAALVATAVSLWWWGRVMRLDGWFQLLYPFPAVFGGMRWGPRTGLLIVLASVFWVNFTLGPFSGLSYLTSQGLSTLLMMRGFWDDRPPLLVILPCVLAKMLGFATLIGIISVVYAMDILKALAKEGEVLVNSIGSSVAGTAWAGPTAGQIQMVIVLSFLLHSIVYSICAHLSTSMLLYRLGKHLKRQPRMLPVLKWVLRRASDRYKSRYGKSVEETW